MYQDEVNRRSGCYTKGTGSPIMRMMRLAVLPWSLAASAPAVCQLGCPAPTLPQA